MGTKPRELTTSQRAWCGVVRVSNVDLRNDRNLPPSILGSGNSCSSMEYGIRILMTKNLHLELQLSPWMDIPSIPCDESLSLIRTVIYCGALLMCSNWSRVRAFLHDIPLERDSTGTVTQVAGQRGTGHAIPTPPPVCRFCRNNPPPHVVVGDEGCRILMFHPHSLSAVPPKVS